MVVVQELLVTNSPVRGTKRRPGWKPRVAGRACVVAFASYVASVIFRCSQAPAASGARRSSRRPSVGHPLLSLQDSVEEVELAVGRLEYDDGQPATSQTFRPSPTFLLFDEKDGKFCGKEGDMCKCFGHVRYGRLFTWTDDLVVDGSVNCSAAIFGDVVPMAWKICKCYPTICTTDVGICTPEPCSCPTSSDPSFDWVKKPLMTSDGVKCWACSKQQAAVGIVVDIDSPYCPVQIGRCSVKRACTCQSAADTKRLMRTKEGQKCWTCASLSDGGDSAIGGQKAMFWMLPLLWPFMDFPNSAWEVCNGCRALTVFCSLCLLGYLCQTFVPLLRLDQYFSFYAPCMKKGEFWRLFTYFMLHSDLQHLCVNMFHLLDALDLEGVPDLEVSPGVPLRCSRDGAVSSVCYPDIGVGSAHVVAIFALVLAYGALIGTIRNFGALVQGASSVCFGIDGALIALYGMFLGAGLDQQLKIPEFGAFFWMRIGIISFHISIDIFQGVCGAGTDTVGTAAHMASLVAGFCYVILILPPIGDGSLFDSDQPYIIDCGLTSPMYVTTESATSDCLAFFRRSNGIEVGTAKQVAIVVLGGGVFVSAVNAFRNRHISDDGVACCSCGDAAKIKDATNVDSAVTEATSAQDPQRQGEVQALEQQCHALRDAISHLERLYANMPDPETFQGNLITSSSQSSSSVA
eukprot:TRINITY_DN76184_c0_g1_i1.p1 TRINITY_DN76184_c0_g1~~TRINITY_DN76184_c0_g1_i1.p1  ORF type:complete len:688 (+),score=99.34 TRINITY_DN76184_c0_g1_i1:94-2157(+)